MRLRGLTGIDKERAVIERQAKHLVRLVDDLLDVARIAQGKIELKQEPIETARLVAQAIETTGPLLEERKHTLSVKVPATGLLINADASRFAQIIANLLTNAAKYTDKGGHIEVRAFKQENDMVLQVKDSGIGIRADMLPHVFEKFTQENQAIDRSQGGLGLGLAIVKSLVSLHGGSARAYSEGLGQGSQFEVRVPLLSSPELEEELSPSPCELATSALSILVVDDIADIRNGLAELLRLSGYRVAVAEDAIAALNILESFKPDVAVMDIGLPGMNGYELALEIRKRPEFEQLSLVALTGYGHEIGKVLARRAGFCAHLVKPIELEELLAVLSTVSVVSSPD
jgi:CheY-like chemotaxis protein